MSWAFALRYSYIVPWWLDFLDYFTLHTLHQLLPRFSEITLSISLTNTQVIHNTQRFTTYENDNDVFSKNFASISYRHEISKNKWQMIFLFNNYLFFLGCWKLQRIKSNMHPSVRFVFYVSSLLFCFFLTLTGTVRWKRDRGCYNVDVLKKASLKYQSG